MSLVEFNEWYGEKGEKLHIYRDEKWIAKHGFEAGQQSQQGEVDKLQTKIDLLEKELTETQAFLNKQNHIKQAKIDELQARVDVYELHTKTLKNIHDNDFKEHSESSYILGNLDGFFECLESDLGEIK